MPLVKPFLLITIKTPSFLSFIIFKAFSSIYFHKLWFFFPINIKSLTVFNFIDNDPLGCIF